MPDGPGPRSSGAQDEHAALGSATTSSPTEQTTSPIAQQDSHKNDGKSSSPLSRAAETIRRASVQLVEDVPTGLVAVASHAAATAPSVNDIRKGSFDGNGWAAVQPAQSAAPHARRRSSGSPTSGPVRESDQYASRNGRTSDITTVVQKAHEAEQNDAIDHNPIVAHDDDGTKSPKQANDLEKFTKEQLPKLPWKQSWAIGFKAALKWVCTIKGLLITVYFLNVVAWGGMVFLLLCKAAPAMCPPTHDGCDDENGARRKWIETDMQILNGFFCLTAFGLAPWRIRNTWLLLVWRGIISRDSKKCETALRRLAGIHRNWFRLRGSEDWKLDEPPRREEEYNSDPTVPLPIKKRLLPPITGIRAPPTPYWKMDVYVWNELWNTIFQTFLAAFMWAYSRRTRPSWTTIVFITLAFACAIVAAFIVFHESQRVKKIEGVRPNEERLAARRAMLSSPQRNRDLESGTVGEKEPIGFTAALRREQNNEPKPVMLTT